MSNLSRRSIVASAAALPALAVPAAATAEHPSDAQLEALSLRVWKAWDLLGDACEKLAINEDLDEARAGEEAANNQLDQAIEDICEVRAHTLCGLIAKARAADLPDGMGKDIAWSISNDLVAMGAVRS
jgi:hypothetical protein